MPGPAKKLLESMGLSAEYGPKGINNSKVAFLSRDKKSVLLGRDSDFPDTTMFPPGDFFGIVVFKIHPPNTEKLVKSLSILLTEVKEFRGKLFVADEIGFTVIED